MAQSRQSPSISLPAANYEEFNAFLVQIAGEITQEELSKMKFLCQGPNNNLPRGELDAIEKPRGFLSFLRQRGKIWPEDVSYLIWLLNNVGNVELAVSIEEKGAPSSPGGLPPNLPCVTTHFIGREADVENIKKKLRKDLCRMVVVVSLPGMGKTEVGIRVSHLLQQAGDLSVIHIRVERHDKLENICGEILDRLSSRRRSQSVDYLLQAKRKLSELQQDIVIVLDNTEEIQGKEFDEFAEWLVKSAPRAQLIITTREDVGFVSADRVCKVRLEPLDTDSSAKLLQSLVEDCSEEHSKELGKLCGGIPLLLVNCSDLLNDGFNPEILIQELRNNPIKLLKTNAAGVYDGLGRFFGKFSEEVKRNLVLFSVFPSTFSAKDIHFLFQDPVQFETVKTRMIKCALLQKTSDQKVRMHPLVQAYCKAERDSLNMVELGGAIQHKFNHHYLGLLKDFSKEFISKNSALIAIQKFRKQKANIMEAINNCFEDTSDLDEKELVIDIVTSTEVLDFVAKVLTPPTECAKLYQKCCDIVKACCNKRRHADSLSCLGFRRLCDVAHSKDNREEGLITLAMFKKAYDMRETLPEEEQISLTHAHTTSKLGVCHVLQGEVEKGRSLILEGLAMKKSINVLLYVATGYCDLGNSYRLCGDYQTAINIWKENTLPVYKEQLGDHPWTATILYLIADSYKALADGSLKQGFISQAEMYFREALELRQRLLGVHQDTARSHVHLSDVLVIQGEFQSAVDELNAALEIQNDILGPQHKVTIETANRLADAMAKMECK